MNPKEMSKNGTWQAMRTTKERTKELELVKYFGKLECAERTQYRAMIIVRNHVRLYGNKIGVRSNVVRGTANAAQKAGMERRQNSAEVEFNGENGVIAAEDTDVLGEDDCKTNADLGHESLAGDGAEVDGAGETDGGYDDTRIGDDEFKVKKQQQNVSEIVCDTADAQQCKIRMRM